MELKIYSLSAEQAMELQGFMMPAVRTMPDYDKFWYFAAVEAEAGVIGMAVIAPYIPEAELLSIAVSPAYTRLGVASELLQYAIEQLNDPEISALRVTRSQSPLAWNALGGLMERNGFLLEEEYQSYKGTLAELTAHPLLAAEQKASNIYTLAELSETELGSLIRQVAEDELFDPAVLEECNPACSFIWKEQAQAKAIFLLSPLQDGHLTNLYTWMQQGSQKAILALLQQAAKKASSIYPLETEILFTCMGSASNQLLLHFLPDAEPIQLMRSYWYGMLLAGEEADAETFDMEGTDAEKTDAEENIPGSDREAYWNDFRPIPIDDSDLYCASCKYRIMSDLIQCEKYKQKPGDVLYGAPCAFFEK